jgi:hypothetical protein
MSNRKRAGALLLAALAVLLVAGTAVFSHSLGRARWAPEDLRVSLKVQPEADGLLLSWDRNSTLVASADRATLTITDGSRTEDVDLDLNYFRGGRIRYQPIGRDVRFRLLVSNQKEGRYAVESVRLQN